MRSYLDHLHEIGDQEVSFKRKLGYIDYNYGYLIKDNQKVLEIGPGNGELVSYLNSHLIHTIDIIDNDSDVLTDVKKRFKIDKSFLTEDISKIKNQLKKYDLIFMLQVFEHIPKDQYKKFLSTLITHLSPKGKIVMMVPNGGNPLNMLERYHDIQHQNAFTEDSLKELPNYCDIENVTTEVAPYNIPPNSVINIIRIILQKILHLVVWGMIIINGGVYQTIMTPNITLILTKNK